MIIDLRLLEGASSIKKFRFEPEFQVDELKKAGIRGTKDLVVDGLLEKLREGSYYISMAITGKLILPCSISLEDTLYNVNIIVDENITEGVENEENIEISQFSIDIRPIVWQNIVMEVPLRIVNEDAKEKLLQGNEEELTNEVFETKNNPLSDLKKLLEEK